MLLPTPPFWFQSHSKRAHLLRPLGWLVYAGALIRRAFTQPIKISVPVICVGNHVVGGAGKTPVTLDIARRLQAMGHIPHIITRGYGGRARGVHRVDPAIDTAAYVGDEALLLAAAAPVWVAKNRTAGMVAAMLAGADCCVLDDGLQNPTFLKDLSLLVIDKSLGNGNGFLFPAGPLREPLATAIARADALLEIGGEKPEKENHQQAKNHGKPILHLEAHTVSLGRNLSGENVFALCGLARPRKFHEGLQRLGATLAATRDFPDHYTWPDNELADLLLEAKNKNAQPVTTAKDAARMSPFYRDQFVICDVKLLWKNEAALDALLQSAFA